MVQYYGLGLLTPGVGLFHTVFTQAETVNLSVLGDRDIIPDPDFYIQCLREAWEELDKATAGLTPKQSAGKPQPKKKATRKKAASKKATGKAAKKAPRKQPAAKKRPVKKKAAAKKKSATKTTRENPSSPRAVESSTAPTRLKARRKPGAPAPKLKVVSG